MKGVHHQKTGHIGEEVACLYLTQRGFSIKERNYRRKWGELDIVAEDPACLYFCEVKSTQVSASPEEAGLPHRPEEKVTPEKQKRIARSIITYFSERRIPLNTPFQIDILVVYIHSEDKDAYVRRIPDVVIEEP